MRLPDRGRLGVLPLPVLLLLLEAERFSGRLALSHEAAACTVLLRDGRPVRISNGAGRSLAAALEAAGRLSHDDAARVAAQAEKLGGSEEKALLTLRLLSPRDLYRFLRDHERDALLACFAWPDGTFELSAGDVVSPEAAAFAHDPALILHAGVSLHWDEARSLAALGPAGRRLASRAPDFDALAAPLRTLPGFEALAAGLDGQLTLADAARAAGGPSALALALVLDTRGALTYTDAPAAAASPETAPSMPAAAEGPEIEIVVAEREEGNAGRAAAERDTAKRPPATAPPVDRHADIRNALVEKHRQLGQLDYYALLGVAQGADAAAIRRAYVNAAKTFHPDAIARLGLDDVREIANVVFARISKAQAVLSDPALRREYDDTLSGGGADEAQRFATAETFYRKAEILLRKGSFDDALQFLRPAVELCDDDAAYRCAFGWALFKKQVAEPDAARSELERAVAIDPANALAHYRLGMVLRALGKATEAAASLARARQLDPGTMLSR
jgi:tetratricopeptide (TPR) repeat protein